VNFAFVGQDGAHLHARSEGELVDGNEVPWVDMAMTSVPRPRPASYLSGTARCFLSMLAGTSARIEGGTLPAMSFPDRNGSRRATRCDLLEQYPPQRYRKGHPV